MSPDNKETKFQIEIDTLALEDRVTKVFNKLQVLPVIHELTRWQAEDMKRKYPKTEQVNPTTGITRIYPRSRRQAKWLKEKRAAHRQFQVNPKPKIRRGTPIVGKSTRPILRPELFERLRERMLAMLVEKAGW